jgi:epoxyqueuosine reductase
VLLHAQRCLTFANELPGPWPEWVPATAHHCLIGCLACQRCCPANPRLAMVDSGVVFSADETRALLAAGTSTGGRDDDGLRGKVENLGLSEDANLLGRNLRALLDRRGHARQGDFDVRVARAD